MVGPEELRVVEQGTEVVVPAIVVTFNRLAVEVLVLGPDSGFEVCGWLCSPSYVATTID